MVLSKMEQKDMYLSTSHVSFESEVVAEYQRDRDGDRQTEREREIVCTCFFLTSLSLAPIGYRLTVPNEVPHLQRLTGVNELQNT